MIDCRGNLRDEIFSHAGFASSGQRAPALVLSKLWVPREHPLYGFMIKKSRTVKEPCVARTDRRHSQTQNSEKLQRMHVHMHTHSHTTGQTIQGIRDALCLIERLSALPLSSFPPSLNRACAARSRLDLALASRRPHTHPRPARSLSCRSRSTGRSTWRRGQST